MVRIFPSLLAALIGIALALPSVVYPQEDSEDDAKTGVFIDFAYGWTTVRGNDVRVGDRTAISMLHVFDESVFEPLVTRMSSDWMPYASAGYQEGTWGVVGEFWRIDTGARLDGMFDQGHVRPRYELLRMWEAWHGEDWDEARYAANNDLRLSSVRVDLTRSVTGGLSLAMGLHVADWDNERSEEVYLVHHVLFPNPFVTMTNRDLSVRAKVSGLLLGPSLGLRGTASAGDSVSFGCYFAQSVLFGDVDHDAGLLFRFVEPFAPPDITVGTTYSSRASIPVTDVRLSMSVDLGENVSLGVLGLASIWYDVPTALAFNLPFEQWTEVGRTIVLASIGPKLTIRF